MVGRVRSHVTYANVVATLALLIAIGGGTAWAVEKWTGANIVNGSLTGVDVRNDTLKGADVLESRLAKVPDSDKLDGLDSARYTRGAPAEAGAFAPAKGRTYFNRLAALSGSAVQTLLVIPGLLHVDVECNGLALVHVISDTNGLQMSQDILSGNLFKTYNAGEQFQFNTSDQIPTYQGLVTAGKGDSSFTGQQLVPINLVATFNAANQFCYFQGSALLQSN
jgi:hypothetical protein